MFKFIDKFKKLKRKNLEKESEELRNEKSYLKENISKWLLGLKVGKHNSIKTKCAKWFVKKMLPTLSKWLIKKRNPNTPRKKLFIALNVEEKQNIKI